MSALFLSCDNDDYPYSEVPSVVLNKFWTEFPDAHDVEFRKTGENYEVEFELEEKDFKILIALAGTILKEKKEISWTVLPAELRSSLKEQFDKQDIKDPELVTAGDTAYYQVQIDRFLSDRKIVLDETGKLNNSIKYWN